MTNRVNIRKDPYDVYIGRPSPYGNPYVWMKNTIGEVMVEDRDEAVSRHMSDLRAMSEDDLRAFLAPLVGKTLGCYCGPLQRCHGDNYIELIKELGLET